MARNGHHLAFGLLAAALLLAPASWAEDEPAAELALPTGDAVDTAEPEPLAYDPLFDDDDHDGAVGPVNDPLEPGNRAVYSFNRKVSQYVWDPVTAGYRFVVPKPARQAVRRVFDNLNAPIYVANHLLQLRPLVAAETLGAFLMNSTFGVAGLFDTATGVGFELKRTDFGQTLALVGIGPGPYLMVPFLGPTTVRDGVGFVVDRGFHPATYFFAIPVQLIGYGGIGFAALEEAHDDLRALEDSALDPYAVLRSAYLQARKSAIAGLSDDESEAPAPEAESGAALARGARPL